MNGPFKVSDVQRRECGDRSWRCVQKDIWSVCFASQILSRLLDPPIGCLGGGFISGQQFR